MIESLLGDGTSSWIMIVKGINKYETEMTEETQDDHIDYIGECTGKCVKLFVLGMATVLMVAVFFMVTDVKVV